MEVMLASPRLCIIPDCGRPHLARGWCFLHYSRWRKTGDPLVVIGRRHPTAEETAARFWSHIPNRPIKGCWEWQAGRHQRMPYGKFKVDGRTVVAHSYAWTLATGDAIPDGFDVLHACDNPPCVRNDDPGIYVVNGIARPRFGHLWLGTHQDNMADRDAKGRAAVGDQAGSALGAVLRRGEGNGRAVLTLEQITEIRRLNAEHGWGKVRLSRMYPVSQAQIGRILRGEQW